LVDDAIKANGGHNRVKVMVVNEGQLVVFLNTMCSVRKAVRAGFNGLSSGLPQKHTRWWW
jgi:hypothetical protein